MYSWNYLEANDTNTHVQFTNGRIALTLKMTRWEDFHRELLEKMTTVMIQFSESNECNSERSWASSSTDKFRCRGTADSCLLCVCFVAGGFRGAARGGLVGLTLSGLYALYNNWDHLKGSSPTRYWGAC